MLGKRLSWPVERIIAVDVGLTEEHRDNLRPDSWLKDWKMNTVVQEYKAATLNPPL